MQEITQDLQCVADTNFRIDHLSDMHVYGSKLSQPDFVEVERIMRVGITVHWKMAAHDSPLFLDRPGLRAPRSATEPADSCN